VRVAIHQPQYFPWPPYVHKVMSADVFVYLDTVQYSKNGVQNRNQIKTPQGALWLTLPVAHPTGRPITGVDVADPAIGYQHWKTLSANYARTPGFIRWRDDLRQLCEQPFHSLADVAIASTEWLLQKLGAGSRRLRASEIANVTGEGSRLVASLCSELRATEYLSGRGALAYLDRTHFDEIGCRIALQTWTALAYPQAHAQAGFITDLSALDLLLNCPDEASALINRAGGWESLQAQ
jgi:WbqC-like protein family